MEEDKWILLIAHSEVEAKKFRLQIVLHQDLKEDLQFQHCRSIEEALSWLGQNQLVPYIIAIDVENPDATPTAVKHLREAAPGAEYLLFTEKSDRNTPNPVVKRLEQQYGSQQVFSKADVTNSDKQAEILERIHEAVIKRTSGSSRERDRAIEEIKGRTANCEEEIMHLEKIVDRLNSTLYGVSNPRDALVYQVTLIGNQVESLRSDFSVLVRRLEAIEEETSNAKGLLRLQREKFGVVALAVALIVVLMQVFGIDLREFVIDLVKAIGKD